MKLKSSDIILINEHLKDVMNFLQVWFEDDNGVTLKCDWLESTKGHLETVIDTINKK